MGKIVDVFVNTWSEQNDKQATIIAFRSINETQKQFPLANFEIVQNKELANKPDYTLSVKITMQGNTSMVAFFLDVIAIN